MTLLEWLFVIFVAWLAFGKGEPRRGVFLPKQPTTLPQVRCPPPPPTPTCSKCDWVGTPSGPILCDQHRSFIHQNPPPQSMAPVSRNVNRPRPPLPVGERPA